MKAFFICLFLIGCGSPLLQPGDYNLTGEITESDWGATGDEIDGVWEVTEDDGKYTAKFDWADWKLKGKEHGQTIVLDHHQDFDDISESCDDYNHINVIVTPNEEGNQFDAIWFSELHMCSINPCGMVPPGTPGCEPIEASITETINIHGKKK